MNDYPPGCAEIVCPPKHGLYLCGKDGAVERLGDKIVRAHFHGGDDIHVVRSGGNEKYRYFGYSSDLPAPMISVEKRERYVDKRDMRRKFRKFRHHVAQVFRGTGFDIPCESTFCYCLCDRRIILDNKHPVHNASRSFPRKIAVRRKRSKHFRRGITSFYFVPKIRSPASPRPGTI